MTGRPSWFVRRQSLRLHRLRGGGPMLRGLSFMLLREPPSEWAHYFIPVFLRSSLFLLSTGGGGPRHILNFLHRPSIVTSLRQQISSLKEELSTSTHCWDTDFAQILRSEPLLRQM